MLQLNSNNETSRLRAVVLGSAISNGPTPKIEDAYDPKSLEHILAGTYPLESAMVMEIEAFNVVLKKYRVTVFRPKLIANYNQMLFNILLTKLTLKKSFVLLKKHILRAEM